VASFAFGLSGLSFLPVCNSLFHSLLSGSVPWNGLFGLLYEVKKKAFCGDYVCSFVTVLTTKLLDLHEIGIGLYSMWL
jgi:hypothetical protein